MAVIELCGEIASKLICRSCVAFSERIEPVTRFIMHREFKLDFSHLSATSVRGLRLTQESELPACGDHMCFNICHQMSALLGWGCPEVNKFESVSSDDHEMLLAEEEGPCTMRAHVRARHDWKHYLPATSLAGGKKQHHWTSPNITFDVQGINKWNPLHSLLIFRQHQRLTLGDLNWLIF